MGTFVSGFIVGFTAVWQLALVTLAVVPLIAVIGGIHTTALAKLSSKSQDALSEASNIAEQVRRPKSIINSVLSFFFFFFFFFFFLLVVGSEFDNGRFYCVGIGSN